MYNNDTTFDYFGSESRLTSSDDEYTDSLVITYAYTNLVKTALKDIDEFVNTLDPDNPDLNRLPLVMLSYVAFLVYFHRRNKLNTIVEALLRKMTIDDVIHETYIHHLQKKTFLQKTALEAARTNSPKRLTNTLSFMTKTYLLDLLRSLRKCECDISYDLESPTYDTYFENDPQKAIVSLFLESLAICTLSDHEKILVLIEVLYHTPVSVRKIEEFGDADYAKYWKQTIALFPEEYRPKGFASSFDKLFSANNIVFVLENMDIRNYIQTAFNAKFDVSLDLSEYQLDTNYLAELFKNSSINSMKSKVLKKYRGCFVALFERSSAA